MKWVLRISTIFVSTLFIFLLIFNLYQLFMYEKVPSEYMNVDFSSTYFGFRSILTMGYDYDLITGTFYNNFWNSIYDFTLKCKSIFDNDGYFYHQHDWLEQWLLGNSVNDFWINSLTGMFDLLNFIYMVFYPLFFTLYGLTYLVSPIFAVIYIFIKAMLGYYNLPLEPSTILINLRMLLR